MVQDQIVIVISPYYQPAVIVKKVIAKILMNMEHQGNTKNIRPRSIIKMSAETRVINLPELVYARDFAESLATLSKIAATNSLRILSAK